MNDLKKITKTLLFPPAVLRILLTPASITFLIYAMTVIGTESIPAYLSYVLAAYTLTLWCIQIPNLLRSLRSFLAQNKYTARWKQDIRLRINISLSVSFAWNLAYALLQLGLGWRHGSFWFYSLAGYYLSLGCMRLFLVHYTGRHRPKENMQKELKTYRCCGWIFLILNLALSLMIFFMVYWDRTFVHSEITTIALAAYSFTALTAAIVNLIKYRRYDSPVFSAKGRISLAAASVSMLTLTSTMLTTFGDVGQSTDRRIWLGLLGGAISCWIIAMAIDMIVTGTQKLRSNEYEVSHEST